MSSGARSRHIVVIGGGPAGISAARHLAAAGTDVTLLEQLVEVGGSVRTVRFAGHDLDVGAEALYTAAPEPLRLLADLGLDGDLVTSTTAPTWIVTPSGLRPLPAGVGPAGPTRVRPLLRSRLLSSRGFLRAAAEPFLPRTDLRDDEPVGAVITARFGTEVVARIVDPLLGGLHAGDVNRLSLDATAPGLAAILNEHRSVILGVRGRQRGAPPRFVTVRGGLAGVFRTAVAHLAGDVVTGHPVETIAEADPGCGRYHIEVGGRTIRADGVVIAAPAHAAAAIITRLSSEASRVLSTIEAASVAVALLAYPPEVTKLPAMQGTGLLVPSSSGRMLKAATFLGTKWPHLSGGLVRASAGRSGDLRPTELDDRELVRALRADLEELTGISTAPTAERVVRWPRSMPQLEVGHRGRIAAARHALRSNPAVALAGASYDGVGVPAALRSGVAAADQVLSVLAGARA